MFGRECDVKILTYESLAFKKFWLQMALFPNSEADFADLNAIHAPHNVPIIMRIGTETALRLRRDFLLSTINFIVSIVK